MPLREALEPLGNELAMNVFATSVRDNSSNKEPTDAQLLWRSPSFSTFENT